MEVTYVLMIWSPLMLLTEALVPSTFSVWKLPDIKFDSDMSFGEPGLVDWQELYNDPQVPCTKLLYTVGVGHALLRFRGEAIHL